jgi:hypothetical protein
MLYIGYRINSNAKLHLIMVIQQTLTLIQVLLDRLMINRIIKII